MKRFTTIILVALLAALIVLNILGFLAIRGHITRNERLIAAQVTQAVQRELEALPQPLAPKDGRDGIDGRDGRDGKDGVTQTIETKATEIVTKPAEKGEKGDAGQPGKSARQIVLKSDPDTGDLMWKYADDTLWNLLLEKCQITNSCGDEQ